MKAAALLACFTAAVAPPDPGWAAQADAPEEPAVDRGTYFVGDTIANLRGLDPVFPPRAGGGHL